MLALLLDEGLPLRAASALRARGLDCLHVREVGLASAADSIVLEFARKEGRVYVTLDHDFHRLLAESGAVRPSVILIRAQGLRYVGVADLPWACAYTTSAATREWRCRNGDRTRGTRSNAAFEVMALAVNDV